MDLDTKFPAKLHDLLFSDARYRVAYGGRGAAKSWNFARALLLLGVKSPLRILCARETQESISESVHRLLSDQIELLKLGSFYTVEKARIVGANGTEITFAGLKHNVSNEGADICWVEEAQSVSKESWNTLIPTIRKSGSSIWVSFNPDFDDDPTYQMFVKNPPPDAYVCKVTWRDNDWFPEVLKREMEHLRRTDPDEYEHVWEGSCISLLQSAIYANELRAVEREDRICSRPVDCYWDLGYGDMTAIWFAQSMPFQYRLIDYIEDCAKPLQWYLQQMQARGYLYGTDWLPWGHWDARDSVGFGTFDRRTDAPGGQEGADRAKAFSGGWHCRGAHGVSGVLVRPGTNGRRSASFAPLSLWRGEAASSPDAGAAARSVQPRRRCVPVLCDRSEAAAASGSQACGPRARA